MNFSRGSAKIHAGLFNLGTDGANLVARTSARASAAWLAVKVVALPA